MLVGAFAASIVTARTLGPSGRGSYALVVTLSATAVQFGNLGLHSSNTYVVAQRRDELRALLANSLWVSLVIGLGGSLILTAAVVGFDLFPQTPSSDLWLTVALVPPSLFFLLGVNLLIGIGEVRSFNLFEAASAFAVLAFLALAAAGGAGVSGLLGASAAAWWLIGGALLATLRRHAGGGSWRFDRPSFRSGAAYAGKAYLVALLGFLVLRASFFLLARLSGSKELGFFSVAAQIADVLVLVPTATAIVIFPALVRDRGSSWPRTVRAAGEAAVALVVLCGVTAILAPWLVRLAFGAEFAPAAGTLRLMLPGVVALGVTSVLSQYVAAHGMPARVLLVWSAALVVVIGLGRALIPAHGGTGAAVAYSVAYGALLLLMAVLTVRMRRAQPQEAAP
jgi:O-antigen/teichoic acid export membrane protein